MIKLLIALSITCSGFALDTSACKTIHQIVEHISDAWNDHEGHGFADHYAEDADFVNIFGMVFSGKQEIETRHIKILETFLKGSTFEVTDITVREAKPDVAIAIVHWEVSNLPNKEPMKGVFTHVLLKNQENWEITATQNTLISN